MPPAAEVWATTVQRSIALVETLRSRGYPAPRYFDAGELDGVVYSVQERVAGAIPDVLREPHARRLVELTSMHADVADADTVWASAVVEGLRTGTEKVWVDHVVLRGADERVVTILDEVVEVGARTDVDMFRTTDVVHGDFHHRNFLAVGDEVTAVFDWETAAVGDARADLAKLA